MKKKTSVVLIVLLVLMMAITIGMAILFTQFHIESVKVVGNVHYTEEEIKALVLGEDVLDNSLLLDIRNQLKPIENVPFIETIADSMGITNTAERIEDFKQKLSELG